METETDPKPVNENNNPKKDAQEKELENTDPENNEPKENASNTFGDTIQKGVNTVGKFLNDTKDDVVDFFDTSPSTPAEIEKELCDKAKELLDMMVEKWQNAKKEEAEAAQQAAEAAEAAAQQAADKAKRDGDGKKNENNPSTILSKLEGGDPYYYKYLKYKAKYINHKNYKKNM